MKLCLAGYFTLCALLWPASASTAESGPENGPEAAQPVLETVVVTASRRELALSDVAVAITTLDQQDIRAGSPDVLAAAFRGLPGLFFQQTTPGQGIPIIRGLKGSQILHLVDGMRLNNAFFRDAPNQYLALVDPTISERVEVLRGAAGSLYGADAMGGVVQILTTEHRFDGNEMQTRGRLYGGYSSVNTGWTARAEAAMGREGLSLSAGGSYQDIGDRQLGGGKTLRPTAYKSKAADAKLLWDMTASTELMLSAQVLEQPSTPRIDELVPGFGQTEPAAEQFKFQPNRRSFLHARLRHSPDSRWLEQMEIHLARQTITDDRRTQDFGSPILNREFNESRLDGLTAQFTSHPAQHWWLNWGLEIYRDSVSSARQLTDINRSEMTPVRARFPDGSSMDSNAVYAASTWAVNDRLTLDAGLRFSWFDIHLPETTASLAADLSPQDLTGDLRAAWSLNDSLSLLLNLGRGFRPPNIFDLGTLGPRPGNRFNIANPHLQPEQVWSYDLGLRGSHGDWTFEAFVFYLDYRDKITSVATGDTTPEGRVVVRPENRNQVDLLGIEASARWRINEQLEGFFSANYTYGQEQTESALDVPADRIPPLNGRLGLSWKPWQAIQLRSWVLMAAAQNRLSPRDIDDPRINPDGTPGWATFNVDVLWRVSDRTDVGVSLQNIADRRFREHGSGLDGAGRNLSLWADFRY